MDAQSVAHSVEEIDTQSIEEIDAQSVEELNVHMQFKCHRILDNKQKHTKKDMKQKQIKQETGVKVNLGIIFL